MNKLLIYTSLMLIFINGYSDDCIKVSAAFDIGSGATKIKVAKVDTCHQKIIKILHESNRPVGYKQALKKSSSNKLSKSIIDRGVKAIKELKQEVMKYKPISFIAVATSAFRTSSNGTKAALEISNRTGVKINIISQEREAKIGFAGASMFSSQSLLNTIAWDIGGGSMQITSYEGNQNYNIYKGKLAAVSFKNHIIEMIQKKNVQITNSPNPILKKEFKKAKKSAFKIAINSISKTILQKIKKKTVEVIGIGGVHQYAILKKLGLKKGYSQKDLSNYISKNLNKSDAELGGGDYVETSLSNFILVLSFMKAMKVDYVKVGKVNLADGLLLMPELARE